MDQLVAKDGTPLKHTALSGQVLNYLKAAEIEVGLLMNFGPARMEYRELVMAVAPEGTPLSDAETLPLTRSGTFPSR